MREYPDSENSSKPEGVSGIMPKVEDPYSEFPSLYTYTMPMGDNIASSSGSNVRSSLLTMGFKASLVDKAIEEKGEDNIDLLLETLFAKSDPPRAESSDSLDSLFCDDEDINSSAKYDGDAHIKEEPDPCIGVCDDKRVSLLAMSFSLDEVEFAISKLGEAAPVNELVDVIFAARIAGNYKKDDDDDVSVVEIKERNKECTTESLFGTMEKTLKLLEMGFSENEVSTVIEKFGSEVPLEELANLIIDPSSRRRMDKHLLNSLGRNVSIGFNPVAVKKEEYSVDTSESRELDLLEKLKGKRPKENYIDEIDTKRPKSEYDEAFNNSLGPSWQEILGINTTRPYKVHRRAIHQRLRVLDCHDTQKLSMPNSCRSLDKMVAKAPYFFYGNVMNLSHDSWVRISQFLYAIEPEFVHTQLFSALSRKEGYVHNLPSENRFHIVPKPPMTIQEAVPSSKKWWPSWDTRKHLNGINSETSVVSQLCDRLERTVSDAQGFPSVDRQRDILNQSQIFNLVWVGRYKLAAVGPEQIERILGYPENHTRVAAFSLMERLLSLKHCFQVDTLAYCLSGLKHLYPGGLTVLSIYSGIGGAEVALHRLGIRLKAVVSIEASEKNRRILKQWWSSSGQTGELVQMEDIHKLASNKVEVLINNFGGFDFIICQNPCTYSSKGNLAADMDSHASLDFMLFHEFVRVLQRVRSTMGRNESFIEYLMDDHGPFLLPLSIDDNDALPNRIHKPEEEEDFEVSEGSEDESEQPSPPPSFPELEMKIKESIESLGGSVFPKLNWSAPKDAAWISSTGNLCCNSFSEVAILLRASDSLVHDLCHVYDSCSDKTVSRPPKFFLALRKWYSSLRPEMEFRCFVRNGILVGVSQREVTGFYPALVEKKDELITIVQRFFMYKVKGNFESESYTFDIYVTNDDRVKLLDFNPWGAFTLPLLFTWEELEVNSNKEGDHLEFRLVESQCGVRPGLKTAVPYDYLDTSPGSGWDEFLKKADEELGQQIRSPQAGA